MATEKRPGAGTGGTGWEKTTTDDARAGLLVSQGGDICSVCTCSTGPYMRVRKCSWCNQAYQPPAPSDDARTARSWSCWCADPLLRREYMWGYPADETPLQVSSAAAVFPSAAPIWMWRTPKWPSSRAPCVGREGDRGQGDAASC